MSTSEKTAIIVLSFALGLFMAAPSGTFTSGSDLYTAQTFSTRLAFEAARDAYKAQVESYKGAQEHTQQDRATWQSEGTQEARDELNISIHNQVAEMVEMSRLELKMINAWLAWANENRQYGTISSSGSFVTKSSELNDSMTTLDTLARRIAALDPATEIDLIKDVKNDTVHYRSIERKYLVGKYKVDKLIAARNKLYNIYDTQIFPIIEQLGHPAELVPVLDQYAADINAAGDAIFEADRSFDEIHTTGSEDQAAAFYKQGKDQIQNAKAAIEKARQSLYDVVNAIENYTLTSVGDAAVKINFVSSNAEKIVDGSASDVNDVGRFTVVFDVTAENSDIYVQDGATDKDLIIGGSSGISYSVADGSLGSLYAAAFDSNAAFGANNNFKIANGQTKRFILTVQVTAATGTADFVKVVPYALGWAADDQAKSTKIEPIPSSFATSQLFLVPRSSGGFTPI